MRASKKDDETVKNLCRNITLVKPEIKLKALQFFVKKCREKHTIAFLQWRDMFNLGNKMELLDCLDSRIRHFKKGPLLK